MNVHKFIKKYENGTWDVLCEKDGGTFNTILWDLEKEKRQTCPCCKEIITG